MRRLQALGVLVLAAALLSVPDPVESQSTTPITLSVVRVDDNNVEETVTSIGEDDPQFTGSVKASVASAPSSDVTVSVTVGASGSTAALGNSCTAMGATAIDNCGGDYGVSSTAINTAAFDVTITAGETSGTSDLWVKTTPDRVTEEHEIIRISGMTSASGYSVNSVDLTINDADRTVLLRFTPDPNLPEGQARANNYDDKFFGDLGSGTTRDDFVASTSSTYGTLLKMRIYARNGTASIGVTNHYTYSGQWTFPTYIRIPANSITSSQVDNQDRTGTNARISINSTSRNDTIAGDKTFELYIAAPSGFTNLPKPLVVKDDHDDDITLTADTDTAAGVQSV